MKEKNKEIMELKNELIKANKTIESQKLKIKELEITIQNLKNNNQSMNMIKQLEIEIKNKDEALNRLKNELEKAINNQNDVNVKKNQLISVFFQHPNYNYSVACVKNDTFAEVEEKFYKEFPELRNTNNAYLVNGNQVLRFKTIEENKIKNGYQVLLQIPDNS